MSDIRLTVPQNCPIIALLSSIIYLTALTKQVMALRIEHLSLYCMILGHQLYNVSLISYLLFEWKYLSVNLH